MVFKVAPRMASAVYTIRQLTKEWNVTARTLRYYEERGLVSPQRRGATRIYTAEDKARLIVILRGRRLGFSLSLIRDILRMYDAKDGDECDLQLLRKRFLVHEHRLEALKTDVANALAALDELRTPPVSGGHAAF